MGLIHSWLSLSLSPDDPSLGTCVSSQSWTARCWGGIILATARDAGISGAGVAWWLGAGVAGACPGEGRGQPAGCSFNPNRVWSTSKMVPFHSMGGELWWKGTCWKFGSFTLLCWVEWEKDPAQVRAANTC